MKKVLRFLNLKTLTLVAAIGMIVAATSSGHCWLLNFHQRKCPSHLIKED